MESIWQEAVLPDFEPLRGDSKTDVLVIGGGIAGLLCAHCLTQAGIQCIVAEASKIGSGITKGTTAKVTAQHGLIYRKMLEQHGPETAGLYLEANEQAVKALRELCQSMDCDWSDQSNYIYTAIDRNSLEAELAALQFLGHPAELAEELPLPFPTVGAVKFPGQGQFHPMKFLKELSKGLRIFENTRVLELKRHYAVTNRGIIFAEQIIVATHFPFLNKHGSYFLKQYQQRSYVLSLKNTPDFDGMYLAAEKNGLSFRHHRELLLLGGGGHRTGKQGDGWAELESFARNHYPNFEITHHWAAQDCMTLDTIPYIGQYSKNTPNLFVATGFNKWGMSTSMAAARLLTDLVQQKPNPYADVFSPSRSMLHPQLGLNILESTKNLLTPTVPRCPHLGCALKWNPREHSWDCPCHGSRFAKDGRLIDNPATGDLWKRK